MTFWQKHIKAHKGTKVYESPALWLCIVLIALSLALLPLSYSYMSIKIPINCLYGALAVFLVCFYKDIVRIKHIWFVLICMGLVVALAYISLLNAEQVSESKALIRHYLLEPSLFMLLCFLLTTRLSKWQLEICFGLVCVVLLYHPVITLYDFYANGNGKLGYRAMLPRYYAPATVYVFYLIFAFSFAYVGFLKTRGVLKVIFALFMLLGIYAFIANGGRFGLLACVVVLCAPFVCFSYTYKRYMLCLIGLLLIGGAVGVYYASAKWDSRYNLHNALNSFKEVWHTPPAAMGQYLGGGCQSWAKCSVHSKDKTSPIVWEFSSLDRISKLKSTLLAIADNPLRPNGYHFQQFPFNIQHIFALDSLNHPFSLTPYKNSFISSNAHNHNYPSSVFFELGLFGFVGFCAFSLYFVLRTFGAKISLASNGDIYEIFLASVGIGLVGLMVANMFDCIPIRDGQLVLFMLLGVFLGVDIRGKNAI